MRFPNFDKHLHTMELIVVEVTNTYPTRFAKEKKRPHARNSPPKQTCDKRKRKKCGRVGDYL